MYPMIRKTGPPEEKDIAASGKTGGEGISESRDAETDALMERVFPHGPREAADLSAGRIFAVIPEEIVGADLEDFSNFMEQVFEAGEAFDSVVEDLAADCADQINSPRRMEVIVPESLLGETPWNTTAFLDRLFEAFDEIDDVLVAFSSIEGVLPAFQVNVDDTSAVESEDGAPHDFLKAVDRVESNQEKLELMIRQTRHELRRLRRFRLARKSPGRLLADIRLSGELPTLQYLVGFLHSIHVAADSFEKIGIPRPHIRDYLEFLYRMEDWDEMDALVGKLRQAVLRYAAGEGA